jgi:4-hydroxybenzoate polyprenyltransferase
MRWFNFILSHSIFVSFCAGALVYQTLLLLSLPLYPALFGMVFFATLSAYNAYWILCKWSNDKKNQLSSNFNSYSGYFILFIAGAIAVIDYLWQMPYFLLLVISATVLTFLYVIPVLFSASFNGVKNLGFIKTILLALTWSFFTVMVPALGLIQTHFAEVVSLFLMRFFFMLMLCIIFDSRDMAIDKIRNMPSLATSVNKKSLSWIMIFVLIGYLVSLIWLNDFIKNDRYLFVLMSCGGLTFIIYLLAIKKRGYYFYYFLVDGLMLFSSLSIYIATI